MNDISLTEIILRKKYNLKNQIDTNINVGSDSKINNHNQLIDLNGDSINFELTFDIQSNPNDKFEILVVDQNTLDTNENFIKTEYKKSVNGNIQGSVKSDINKYQKFR